MKVYLNKVNEDWAVDQFIKDWSKYNKKITTKRIKKSNVIWIIAPWTWRNISTKYLKTKKVLCTIHHLDFDKFDKNEKKEFYERDSYVDIYHTISQQSKNQLEKLTDKKIVVIPFWVNQNNFYKIDDKLPLYKKYNLNSNNFFIGSFQRDTEGIDLESPKLSKGPDRFLEIVLYKNKVIDNLEVILTGKRRNFIINKLENHKIKYKYFEMVKVKELNELYNILNLYIVSSRIEGGPRSIFECAITKTPIISTDVGFAANLLHPDSIYNMENFSKSIPQVDYAFENVQQYILPKGMDEYLFLFKEFYEN